VKREFSAGGVLVRRVRGEWKLAAIRPAGKKPGLWALPKGNIGRGEESAQTAVREVMEETGATGRVVAKLGDVRYVYTWGGERIFKVVSFFLLRYSRGRLGDLPPATAHEVGALAAAGRGAEAARVRRRTRDGGESPGYGRKRDRMILPPT
jgi:8-oxo-dGTP pyrophosphatase MutT (NUDIX family)